MTDIEIATTPSTLLDETDFGRSTASALWRPPKKMLTFVMIIAGVGTSTQAGLAVNIANEDLKLTASDAAFGDSFDLSVAVCGNVAALGARDYGNAGSSNPSDGQFELSGNLRVAESLWLKCEDSFSNFIRNVPAYFAPSTFRLSDVALGAVRSHFLD